jgi:hypothetical protein
VRWLFIAMSADLLTRTPAIACAAAPLSSSGWLMMLMLMAAAARLYLPEHLMKQATAEI